MNSQVVIESLIKCLMHYDDGNDTWIGNNNSLNEWCVAYHSVGSGQKSETVKEITGKIIMDGFKLTHFSRSQEYGQSPFLFFRLYSDPKGKHTFQYFRQ